MRSMPIEHSSQWQRRGATWHRFGGDARQGAVVIDVQPRGRIVFLIVIVVYQLIENYILQPTIIGKAAKISGFTVLASVLAFGARFGLIGAIIGVPIAAELQIVVEELTAGRRARIATADAAERTR